MSVKNRGPRGSRSHPGFKILRAFRSQDFGGGNTIAVKWSRVYGPVLVFVSSLTQALGDSYVVDGSVTATGCTVGCRNAGNGFVNVLVLQQE